MFAVYGASGTTGALVVAELEARGLEHRALPRGAERALDGVGCVINCAGPFKATRTPIEDGAMAARCHVVHICGERSVLRELFARSHELEAAGITVVGGAGFSSTIADLASWLAIKGLTPPLSITTFHGAVASVPSEGSLRSYLDDLDDLDGADSLEEPQVVELPAPVGQRAVRRVELAEHITLPRSLGTAVAAVTSFVAVGPPRTAVLRPPVFSQDRAALEQLLAWRATQGTRGPTATERAAMAFAVRAVATSADGATKTVDIVGTDPYGLTAIVAVEAAATLVAPGAAHGRAAQGRGARAPLEVLDPQQTLAALARAGVRWVVRRAPA